MFIETKNAYGLVYIKTESIESIIPADVRENKSDTTKLTSGSCISTRGGSEFYVLDSPMDLFEMTNRDFN